MEQAVWNLKAGPQTDWRFPEGCVPRCGDRERWLSLEEGLKARILSRAQAYSGVVWPALPATAFMRYSRDGNRSDWETASFGRRKALAALVLGECIENRGRFMDDIVNGVWCICEESFWGTNAHFIRDIRPLPDAVDPYIDLFAAGTGEMMALTLYLLEDKLSAVAQELPSRIRYELNRRIVMPFLRHRDFWWMGYERRVNNWNPWILSQLITVFLLEAKGDTLTSGMSRIVEQLGFYHRDALEDGGCDEGVFYWNMAGGALFDCLYMLDRASGGSVQAWEDPKVRNMLRYPVSMHVAGDRFLNYGDGSSRPDLSGGVLIRYGRQIGCREAVRLGSSLLACQKQNWMESDRQFCRRVLDLFEPVEEAAAGEPADDEQDAVFPVLQQVVLRQSGQEACGWLLSAKGGHNAEFHNHNDVGSCILYLDGEPVLIDAGVGVYSKQTFSDQRYEIWTMQSSWHNLPEVNGCMQRDGEEYKAANVRYVREGDASFFSLNMEAAYPAEAKLKELKRAYTLDRSAGTVSLTDVFSLRAENGLLKEHMLLAAKPERKAGKIRIPLPTKGVVWFNIPEGWDVQMEERAIQDPKLMRSCGTVVYRLSFKRYAAGMTESFSVRFQKGDHTACIAADQSEWAGGGGARGFAREGAADCRELHRGGVGAIELTFTVPPSPTGRWRSWRGTAAIEC